MGEGELVFLNCSAKIVVLTYPSLRLQNPLASFIGSATVMLGNNVESTLWLQLHTSVILPACTIVWITSCCSFETV